MKKNLLLTAAAVMMLTGCVAAGTPGVVVPTPAPLSQATIQANLANATYLLEAVGCPLAVAGLAATPVISISGDAHGNQVLTALNASNAALCRLVVPPTAVPTPVPANTAPVTLAPAPPAPAVP